MCTITTSLIRTPCLPDRSERSSMSVWESMNTTGAFARTSRPRVITIALAAHSTRLFMLLVNTRAEGFLSWRDGDAVVRRRLPALQVASILLCNCFVSSKLNPVASELCTGDRRKSSIKEHSSTTKDRTGKNEEQETKDRGRSKPDKRWFDAWASTIPEHAQRLD